MKNLPAGGPLYTSPLRDASVCNDIHSLDIAISQAQLASERAAYDIDLLFRHRAQILQGADEEYEDTGGFADHIRGDEMDVDE